MATKSKHDLLIEKIRSRYEGNTTKNKNTNATTNYVQEGLTKDDLNWYEKLIQFNLSLQNGLLQKLGQSFEGFVDLGANLLSDGAELFGADDFASRVNNFASRDLTTELMSSDFYTKLNAWSTGGIYGLTNYDKFKQMSMDSLNGQGYYNVFGEGEKLPEILQNITDVGGSVLGSVATASLGGALGGLAGATGAKIGSNLGIIASAGGQSSQQALQQGASSGEALGYGLLRGTQEALLEKFTGDALGKIFSKIGKTVNTGGKLAGVIGKTTLDNTATRVLKNFTEEGLEEVLSDVLDPITKSLTYDDRSLKEIWDEDITPESLLETFIYSGLMGGVIEGGNTFKGATQHGSLKGYNFSVAVENIKEINEQAEKALKNGNEAEYLELMEMRKYQESRIAKKYSKFIEDVKSKKVDIKAILNDISENGTIPDTETARQINNQTALNEFELQRIRDIRQSASQSTVNVGTRGNKINVQIGEVEAVGDGRYRKIKGSYYDTKTGKIVLKSSQIKYNKIAEVLGHEMKHVFESKELTDALLEDLSETDYKRLYDEYSQSYSVVEDFNQLSEEAKQEYIRQEISADILGSMFENLNQLERAFKKMDAKGLTRLMYNVQSLFDGNRRRFKNYKQIMEALEKARNNYIEKHGAETTETESGEVRYSIQKDAEGEYIYCDLTSEANLDTIDSIKDDRTKILDFIRTNLKTRIDNLDFDNINFDGHKLIINKNKNSKSNSSLDEYSHSKNSYLSTEKQIHAKALLVDELHNVFEIAEFLRTEPPKTPKTKATHFYKFRLKAEIDGTIEEFEPTMIIKEHHNGNYQFYDIKVKEKGAEAYADSPQNSVVQQGASTPRTNSIPQNNNNNNTNRHKLDNTSNEYVSEEYALGTDEYGSKRLIEGSSENARYSVDIPRIVVDLKDDYDVLSNIEYTTKVNDEEKTVKVSGLTTIKKAVEAYKKNNMPSVQLISIKNFYVKMKDYLEHLITNPKTTPKEIENALNYAYNIDKYIKNEIPDIDEIIRTQVSNSLDYNIDLSKYYSQDSEIVTRYNKLKNPKYQTEEEIKRRNEIIEEHKTKEVKPSEPKKTEATEQKPVEKKKEETKKASEQKPKRTATQIAKDTDESFKEIVDKCFEEGEETAVKISSLFDKKLHSKIEKALWRIKTGTYRSYNYNHYGLEYLEDVVSLTEEEVIQKYGDEIHRPSAERVYNAFAKIKEQILEIYDYIDENISKWAEEHNVEAIENANKLVNQLSGILEYIDDTIGDSDSNIFDELEPDDTYTYDYLYKEIQEFYKNDNKYYSLLDKLDGVLTSIENTKKQQEFREAMNYGGTQSTTNIPSGKNEGVQNNNVEETRTTSVENESTRISEDVEKESGLPTSSEGTIEESRDDSSGVHTDSETVVEQEQPQTTENVVETTEEQVETPTETNEVETEQAFTAETVASKVKTEKIVSVQIRSVIIKNTRYKSPADNAKTLRWGAELYNKKVYNKNKDARPLRERVAKYLHKEHGQSFVVEGKGAEMLEHEIMTVLNSIDKDFSVKDRIETIYNLIEKHITKPNKDIKKAIKKFVKETIENGGRKSRMVKLVEATTELAKERYAKDLDDAYKTLKETLDMVDVYKQSIDDLNQEITKINEQSEQNALENSKKIKELTKSVNKLTKEVNKLTEAKDKNNAKVKELQKTLSEMKTQLNQKSAEVEKLKKKVKSANTKKTTVSTALHGKKVINSSFRKGLDAIDLNVLEEDGYTVDVKQVDDELYNQIAHRLSVEDFDGAVEKYLEFIGGFEVTDSNGNKTKLNDGSKEWQEFEKQIKQFFKDFYYEAETSTTQELKDKAKEKEALMKGVVSLIKSSYAIKNKLRKNKGIVQTISSVAKNLVKGIAKPSVTNLKNGTYRQAIKEAYVQLTKKINGHTILDDLGYEFNQDVLDMMNQIGNGKGDLTIEEIQDLTKIMRYMSKFLTQSAGGKVHDGMTDRQRAIEGIKKQKSLGEHIRWHSFLQALSPRVVAEYMDQFNDGINTYIYNKMLEGESREQKTFVKLFGIMKNFYKTPEGKLIKKNINKKVTIEYKSGKETKTVTATVGELVSVWKLLQRSDSKTHLANSGFTVVDKKGITSEFRFTKESLDSFEQALDQYFEFSNKDSVYGKYITATTKFFKMAKKLKIATDKARLGFSNVLENEEYFPIKVVAHDRLMQLGENTDYMRTTMQGSRNYSWNASVEGLKGMLEVSSVEQVIQIYSTQMARYVGYAETIDMINTLFNYQLQDGDLETGLYKGETLRNVMGKQFGGKNHKSNALEYYNKLLKDVQGIRSHDDGIIEKFRSNFALYQLGANLKVMANQLSALPTALRYLGLGNYLKAHKTLMLGGFDVDVEDMPYTAQYRVMDKTMIDAQTLTDKGRKVAEWWGKGMTYTDNLVIKTIWTGCMMQCNNNKAEATKLFDKIIRETQGFNTLQRSGLLRSDNALIKQMMMFTIQPSHNLSNIMEYAFHAIASKKTGKKITAEQHSVYVKSIVGIALEGAMYTAIGMLFKYLLDKDEEDEYEIENILESYFNDNIIGMIPFLNNIEVDFQAKNGKYIQFNDFNLGAISQVYEAFEEVQNIFTSENIAGSFKSLMYALGMLTGIPTRNMNNYGTMILKAISSDTAYNWEIKSNGKSLYNKEIVNTALERKQTKKAWNYYKAYTDKIVELDETTARTLFDLYAEGYTDAYIKQIPTVLDTEDETIVVDREKFAKTYSQVSVALKKLISNYKFKNLSKINKEKLIKKLVNYYYQIAYKEQSGKALTTLEYLAKDNYLDVDTLIYLNEIANITETSKMTRKDAVQKYINKLPISRNEKFTLFYLAGYKLTEDKQRIVKNFLRSKGVSRKTLNALFE